MDIYCEHYISVGFNPDYISVGFNPDYISVWFNPDYDMVYWLGALNQRFVEMQKRLFLGLFH